MFRTWQGRYCSNTIGSKNLTYNDLDIDASILAENIIKIGKKWISCSIEEVVISSIFSKKELGIVPLLGKLMVNYWHEIKFWKAYFNHLYKRK